MACDALNRSVLVHVFVGAIKLACVCGQSTALYSRLPGSKVDRSLCWVYALDTCIRTCIVTVRLPLSAPWFLWDTDAIATKETLRNARCSLALVVIDHARDPLHGLRNRNTSQCPDMPCCSLVPSGKSLGKRLALFCTRLCRLFSKYTLHRG